MGKNIIIGFMLFMAIINLIELWAKKGSSLELDIKSAEIKATIYTVGALVSCCI